MDTRGRYGRLAAPDLVTGMAPILKTDRIELRALGLEDAEDFFPILKDPQIYRFIPEDPPGSPDSLRRQIERFLRGPGPEAQDLWLNWGVFIDAEPIGRVQATIKVPDRKAEIAYVFGMARRKQGWASAAVFTMCKWLFEESLNVLSATIDTRNVDSIALVTRLGFHEVSRAEHAGFFKGLPSHEVTFSCRSEHLCKPRLVL